jgi:hypothetical protein
VKASFVLQPIKLIILDKAENHKIFSLFAGMFKKFVAEGASRWVFRMSSFADEAMEEQHFKKCKQ